MKLQYRYYETTVFKHMIKLYCNGRLTKSYEVYCTELNDEIDNLEKLGYVFGYTKQEVEVAKKQYEKLLANIITEEANNKK